MIPKAIDLVNNRINRQLSFGYDIGKGFVVAEEEVSKIIDQLVLDPKIAADLKMRCDFTRLQVVKSLGIFFACLFVCLTLSENYSACKDILDKDLVRYFILEQITSTNRWYWQNG